MKTIKSDLKNKKKVLPIVPSPPGPAGIDLLMVTERHDLIPLTSRSDRREVPGIEATGHFSDM